MRKLIAFLSMLLVATAQVSGQSTLQHPAKVQVKPNDTTTYVDTLRIWGGMQAGAGGAVQIINQDGSLNINSSSVPAGSITFGMWDDNGCSSGQIPKWSGSAWACDTDIIGGGGGGGTLSSISLVMPSAIFDISPGTLTADGTFTVTFDTQTANTLFAGPTSGGAATPTFRALVAADLPSAVLLSSDNETITGSWRFNANTVFGDSVTAQQLIHIYKGSAQAGLAIEKGDETERWDIVANTSGLQVVEATGGLAPLTFKADRIGVFTSTPTAGYEVDINGDLKLSGNISVGSYFVNSLIPSVGDTYNIGDLTRPWAQAWISQINATVFAEATATIFGGYSIVGRNAGSTTAVIASGDTTIYLDKDGTSLPVSGDTWILIKSYDMSGSTTPKTEYIKLTSVGTCSGSGATLSCPWTVTRDATGLHGTDPAWNIGTPFMFLGSNGDGRIEFYAVSGIPRMSILRQGATAASATDIVRLGGLDGVAGMSGLTGRYGIFIGEGTTNYMKFQKNVGGGASDPADDLLEVQGTIKALAGQFGSNASNLVQVSSEGLDVGTGAVHGGKTSYASVTDGFWLGNDGGSYKFSIGDAGNYLTWDGVSTLTIAGNGAGLTSLNGGNIQTGTVTATQVAADTITAAQIAANAITASELAANSVTAADILAGTITATELAAGAVTATKINVTQLSAIAADLGTVTAGTITGATIRTAASGARVELTASPNALKWYGASGVLGIIDTAGLRLNADTTGSPTPAASYGFVHVLGDAGVSGLYAYEDLVSTTENRTLLLSNVGDTSSAPTHTLDNAIMLDTSASQDDYATFSSTTLRMSSYAGATNTAQTVLTAKAASFPATNSAKLTLLDTEGGSSVIELIADVFTIDANSGVLFALSTTELTLYPDLNVDSGVLFVDVSANRVGINDSTPSRALEVVGDTQITTGTLYISNTAGSAGTSTSGIWLGGVGVAHSNIAWQANENLMVFRSGNTPTQTTDSYGAVNLDANGYMDAAGGFRVNGTAGISFTVNPTTCTSLTVTNGIITAKAGC